jgi:orotidine-5'-phosphate decarboxylase
MRDDVRDRLIVALDVEKDRLRPLVESLPDVKTFKVGMEAYYREGADLVRWLVDRGHHVFLDLKLHDIPHQVERAARVLSGLGVRFLTLHAAGGPDMVSAAVRGAADAGGLELLGVTVLTSMKGDELPSVWDAGTSVEQKVLALARIARDAGCRGIVSSPKELSTLRSHLGPEMKIVCPGIRPAGADHGDQRRVATPGDAIAAGADHLVIGRPVTGAPDPAKAATAIFAEIAAAQKPDAPGPDA